MVLLIVTMYDMKVWEVKTKTKIYQLKNKPYLSDIMNNHKTQGTWRIHSGNKRIEHKT